MAATERKIGKPDPDCPLCFGRGRFDDGDCWVECPCVPRRVADDIRLYPILWILVELVSGFGCLTIGILFAMNGALYLALGMAAPTIFGLILAKRMTVQLYGEFKV